MSPSARAWWRDLNLLVPLCLLLATTIYFAASFEISMAFDEGIVNAGFVPKVVSVLMFVALAFLLGDALRARRAGAPTGNDLHLADPLKILVLTAAYIAVFRTVGYVLATLPYVYLLFYVFRFDEQGQLMRIAYALAITGVFYLLFTVIFDVRLPRVGGLL